MPSEMLLATLRLIWTALDRLHLTAALMGGLAVAVWQHPRATRDVDLLVHLGPADLDSVLEALGQAGFRPKREPPVLTLGRLRILQMLHTPPGTFVDFQVDLLLADCEYQREALARRVAMSLPGFDVPLQVLSCEDLILHKLIAGRILDRADVVALLRANHDTLDLAYIRSWAERLQVTAHWDASQREALSKEN
jgi:hypothetical protein